LWIEVGCFVGKNCVDFFLWEGKGTGKKWGEWVSKTPYPGAIDTPTPILESFFLFLFFFVGRKVKKRTGNNIEIKL